MSSLMFLPLAQATFSAAELNKDNFQFDYVVYLAPLLVLVGTVLLILTADILLRAVRIPGGLSRRGHLLFGFLGTLASALFAGLFLLRRWENDSPVALFPATGAPGSTNPYLAPTAGFAKVPSWTGGALVADNLSYTVTLVVCGILLMTILMLSPYLKRTRLFKAELIPLLLLSGCGAILLAMSRDLLVTFISIEILSLPLYVLCGLDERREASRESSLKYFLLGAFASGFFIYGSALIYGVVGHLNYTAIMTYLTSGVPAGEYNAISLIGIALVGVGIAFKLALVPFQAWVPDVYQGAPTPVTAFMATAVKVGIFVAALRFIVDALGALPAEHWRTPLTVFAVASMIVGNLFALHQMSLKRLLAYSAITHTGYLTLALCTGTLQAAPGMLVYLVAYYLASFGAFAIVAYLSPPGQDDIYLDELNELSRRSPATSAAMVVLLLSMIGMPLTAGFIGKLLVFSDAWRAGLHGLVVIAVLNSVVSAYFYLRVVLAMYMQPAVPGTQQTDPGRMSRGYLIPTAIAVGLTLLLGILPDMLIMFGIGHSTF